MNRRKTTAILAALCFVLWGGARAFAASLVAVESLYDFTKATTGSQLAHTFVLKNDGKKAVHITGVQSDCPCVTATFDKSIAPGKTGEVRIVFDTTNRTGAEEHTLTVSTDDAATPTLTLKVRALIESAFGMRPGYARYTYVQKEVPGLISQTMWAEDGADFKVLEVKSPYPHLTTSFREALEVERRPEGQGRQWIVDTVLSPEAPVGALAGWVEVTTDHPKQKVARFQVTGFVRPVVAVTPPSLHLKPRPFDPAEIGVFDVRVFATEEIPVTGVDIDLKGIKLVLDPVRPGRDYKIHFSMTPELAKGDFRGTLRVHMASPKVNVIEVPVTGRLE